MAEHAGHQSKWLRTCRRVVHKCVLKSGAPEQRGINMREVLGPNRDGPNRDMEESD